MKSLALRFLLLFGFVAILFSAFVLYRAHTVSQRHVRELLNQQMALAMEFNLAIRDYAGGQIRPAMERLVDKDEFHPETMSTSFISRQIFERVRKNFPDCIIRFASDDPRNPINKASPDELRVIEYFRQNPGAEPRVQEIEVEGRQYLAHFTPRWMKTECLRCHGEPKDAPAAMLARYGDTASFHRKVGEIMALDTVAVPLDKMNAALAGETRWQSLILAIGLAFLFGAVMLVFRFVVTRRLAAMASHFDGIAAHPQSDQLKPLPVETKDEIGLVGGAFNKMVEHLRQGQALLEERVCQRTTDLVSANEKLQFEIAERQRAETAVQQRADELAALNALGRAVNATLSLEQTTKAGLEGMLSAVRPDLAFLFLREGDRLILKDMLPPGGRTLLGNVPEHRVGECMCGLAVRDGKALYSRDIFKDRRCTWEECKKAGLKSFAALPLSNGQEVVGVIGLACEMERDFEVQGDFLETLANQISIALANARLYEAARSELAERKRGEQTLREHRDKLDSILRAAPTGIGMVCNRILTEVNERICEMTGYTREELLNQSSRLLYPSDAEFEFVGREEYRQIKALGTGTVETRWQRKDGTILEVLLSSTPVHPEDWSAGVTFTALDITERKRSEEMLIRIRKAVECASDAIGMADAQGRHFYQNKAFTDLFEYTTEEVNATDGKPAGYVDKNAAREVFATITSGGSWSGEVQMKSKSGRRFAVQVRADAIKDEDGRVIGLVGVHTDITERKRAEASLLQMAHVSAVSSDYVVLIGSDFRYLFANDGYLKARRLRPEEIVGHHMREIVGPERFEQLGRPQVEAGLRGEEVEAFEWSDFGEGNLRFLHVRVTPFREADGTISGVVMSGRDITERKRAEEEREKLQSQLTQAQKMQSVGRLAGGVAHDFNNMLQVISGNVSLALLDLPVDSPVRDSLLEVQKSAQRSADLTRQLLAFARKQTIAPKVLDLNDTLAGMLKMLRRLIGEDINLSWMPGANLWPVKLDPSQIDQVLANLCVNARDAIGGVGTVTIETTNVTLDDTYVQSHPECVPGEYVMLAVSDTGKGMDFETRSHLFEPFFTTKEQGKGTGLGLATVFGIVKQNLGLISVYSEPGQGTTFKLYLPRAEAQEIAAVAVARKKDLRGTETILLVEDEDQILVLAKRILQQHGYTVLASRSPEAALKLAEQHSGRIHLLITDVVMPGMNGRELRQRLAALQPELRCLYMSGYTANVIAHHGVLDEGVQFLQKPFTIESLAEQVREALKQSPGS